MFVAVFKLVSDVCFRCETKKIDRLSSVRAVLPGQSNLL